MLFANRKQLTEDPENRADRFWRRPIWTLLGLFTAITLVTAVLGPFGSYPTLDFGGRLLYWGSVVALSIVLVAILRTMVIQVIGRGRHPFVVDMILAPLFNLLYTPPLYYMTERVSRGEQPFSLVQLSLIVFGVTFCVIVVRELFGLHAPGVAVSRNSRRVAAAVEVDPEPDAPTADHPPPAFPPLIDRLPDAARGPILSISGSDHYVEVRTERGSAAVLLRFSDALREIGPVPGERVHRSHWVADAAVDSLRRDGQRHFVVLKTGDELPVSRTYVTRAQERWGTA